MNMTDNNNLNNVKNTNGNILITRDKPPSLQKIKITWQTNMCNRHFEFASDSVNDLRIIKELYKQYKEQYNVCLCCGNYFMNTPERIATRKPRFWGYCVNDHFHCCHPSTWSI